MFCRTVTLKKLRADLEQDLGLGKDALKPHKSTIAGFVDEVRTILSFFCES